MSGWHPRRTKKSSSRLHQIDEQELSFQLLENSNAVYHSEFERQAHELGIRSKSVPDTERLRFILSEASLDLLEEATSDRDEALGLVLLLTIAAKSDERTSRRKKELSQLIGVMKALLAMEKLRRKNMIEIEEPYPDRLDVNSTEALSLRFTPEFAAQIHPGD